LDDLVSPHSAFVYVPVLTWMIFMLSVKSYGNSIEDMKALELFMNMMQYNKAEKEAFIQTCSQVVL
jgi:hypothetical protein